ncbi:ribonuclease HII [Candidatus Njordibacter sp. Uisw_039]|uniref:ribonuclease HII n=1 Tax=Candidatus Njordibacter sp. Uisw_039 TaxID=3230972 RepID=UPI003D53195A
MSQQVAIITVAPRVGVVCGVDEAGRGPLFGEVVAAAVVLDPAKPILGLGDSKKLTEKVRERLYEQIYQHAISVGVGRASVEEIDQLNILHASMLAMQRAVESLDMVPDLALIDGNCCPSLMCASEAIIKGDAKEITIGAASIIAKVTRDREMLEWHKQYPCYGLDKHKGYPTQAHMKALDEYGISPHHRRSFAPVRRLIGT